MLSNHLQLITLMLIFHKQDTLADSINSSIKKLKEFRKSFHKQLSINDGDAADDDERRID